MKSHPTEKKNAVRAVVIIILIAALFLVAGFMRLADLIQKNNAPSSTQNTPANTIFPPSGFRGPTGPPHVSEPPGPPPNY